MIMERSRIVSFAINDVMARRLSLPRAIYVMNDNQAGSP